MLFAVFRISLAGPGEYNCDIIASFYIILINLYSYNCQAVCSYGAEGAAGGDLRVDDTDLEW